MAKTSAPEATTSSKAPKTAKKMLARGTARKHEHRCTNPECQQKNWVHEDASCRQGRCVMCHNCQSESSQPQATSIEVESQATVTDLSPITLPEEAVDEMIHRAGTASTYDVFAQFSRELRESLGKAKVNAWLKQQGFANLEGFYRTAKAVTKSAEQLTEAPAPMPAPQTSKPDAPQAKAKAKTARTNAPKVETLSKSKKAPVNDRRLKATACEEGGNVSVD